MRILQLTVRALVGLSAILCPLLCTAGETLDLGTTLEFQGKVPDMQQQIQSSGLSFRVELRDIQYAGKICRTLIEPTAQDRMTVWVALEDAVLTIQRTEISGRRHSAQCGPLQMMLGNRRDLWIAFEVERKQEAGAEKLELLKTRFKLPGDNWSVGSPSWVTTSGFGMTEGKVVNGLRSGLANRSESVERQLIRVAPQIFSQLENEVIEDLKAKETAQVVSTDANESADAIALQTSNP